MSISLYEASVGTYLQMLRALSGVLEKGAQHCAQNDIDLDTVVQTRLHPDMYAFPFQIWCARHHSLEAIRSLQAGEFRTPSGGPESYTELQALVVDTIQELEQYSEEDINACAGNQLTFFMGEMQIPFNAEGFVLSFSLPNFYFHVTTAYALLRTLGVPLSKLDYVGKVKMAQ